MGFCGVGFAINAVCMIFFPAAMAIGLTIGGVGDTESFGGAFVGLAMIIGMTLLGAAFWWYMFSIARGAYKRGQAQKAKQKAKRQESKRIFARMEARRKGTE